MKRNPLIIILDYVLDYAPIIATVSLATFASLATIRKSISTDEMLQWIIVVLALLATTQLVDRFRIIRSLDGKVERLVENAKGLGGAEAFFIPNIPNLEGRLRDAKSIAINGITLSRTSDSLWTIFKERLAQGTQIRILVVDPEHKALELAASRFNKHQDPQRLQREVFHALDNFESLKTEDTRGGLFQVRLLPYPPAYGIWVIDGESAKGEIWVELYSFRDSPEPTFHLLPHRDGEWFTFFRSQFDTMWNASRIWEPTSRQNN